MLLSPLPRSVGLGVTRNPVLYFYLSPQLKLLWQGNLQITASFLSPHILLFIHSSFPESKLPKKVGIILFAPFSKTSSKPTATAVNFFHFFPLQQIPACTSSLPTEPVHCDNHTSGIQIETKWCNQLYLNSDFQLHILLECAFFPLMKTALR